jgi:alkanesulfonate monooxygenase SsuD/methylene tetrahydromethanopterin reductase-like flavin-dependent oxidoreductase (luciferase family)
VLRAHCEDAGTEFDGIVRSTNMNVVCAATDAEVQDRLRWIQDRVATATGVPERGERAARLFRNMAGTPDQLVERLQPWVDAGLGYLVTYFADAADDTSGLELFARDVVPAFQD